MQLHLNDAIVYLDMTNKILLCKKFESQQLHLNDAMQGRNKSERKEFSKSFHDRMQQEFLTQHFDEFFCIGCVSNSKLNSLMI